MILNLEQIKMITRGTARIEETDGVYRLCRFTEKQAQHYDDIGEKGFFQKTFGTSGVRLAFRTDTTKFSFDYTLHTGSSRGYGYFDVYENGHMTRHFGASSGEVKGGRAELTFADGFKDVEIYFPWSRATAISKVAIDDGAVLEGLYRKYKMISFGDSITQGYDAEHPSLSYAMTLARLLDADSVNKGIGGDWFRPGILCEPDPITPDIITVGYGSNDWFKCPLDATRENCRNFYKRLTELYPDAKIFGFTPLVRLDGMKISPNSGICAYEMDAVIREVCAEFPQVTVINAWKMVPAIKDFYADLRLHPNDLGFAIYAQNLYREIAKVWEK